MCPCPSITGDSSFYVACVRRPSPERWMPRRRDATSWTLRGTTTDEPHAPTVFISYTHQDRRVARRVRRRLEAHGIRAWLDERQLRLGSALTPTILRHIEAADVVVVVASAAS